MTMKKSILLQGLTAAIAMMLTGCATEPTRVSVPAVGPLSGTPEGSLASGTGTLKVFTEPEPYKDGRAPYNSRALCSLYTQQGKLVERFQNVAPTEEEPARDLKLEAGHYVISVPTPGYGQVTVPLVIVAGQITPLFLNRWGMSNKDNLPESDLARLPDGHIVGRRAYPPPPKVKPESGTAKP
jgi:hypothetical protein